MPQAATGNAILLGLGLGRADEFGVPAAGLIRYGAILPANALLVPQEGDSGQINPSGYLKKGIPGAKSGQIEFGHPLTAAHFLEFFEHLFGEAAKEEPEAGIFRYTFTPILDGNRNTHFWGVFDKPPVERVLVYGIRFGTLEMEIGDNAEIPARLSGVIQHGTLVSPAQVVAGSTGTYTLGPWLRGLVAAPSAGSIWVRVTQVAPTVQFKVLQSAVEPDTPTWDAALTVFDLLLNADGAAVWQNVQSSATGLDLGVWAENKDPLDIIFPGVALDHADLDVADTWEFQMPGTWSAPATTEITGAQRFTSAHWLTRFRAIGGPAYEEKPVNSGTVAFEWAVEEDRGNLSRYAFDIIRPGVFTPTVELAKSLVDRFFSDKLDRHERLDMQMAFEGRQLSAALRESVVLTYPSAAVTEDTRPAAEAGKVEETVTLRGETDDAGNPPCTAVVITDRDWDPTP